MDGSIADTNIGCFWFIIRCKFTVPARLLDGFQGVLQTDGYAGYNQVCRTNGITRIGCWDHARRKFIEASKTAPAKKKGQTVSKADVAVGKIRKLYAIEKKLRSWSLN